MYNCLSDTGDGNCLLHAVSLAIWGVPDEAMLLRRLVYLSLVEDFGNAFRKRWKSERMRLDNEVPEGMKLSKKVNRSCRISQCYVRNIFW